jgi:hypothetical protein
MNQRESRNGVTGAAGSDGGEVSALLCALPRVEVPKNFEFGVRAKIAAGSSRRIGFIPFLKVAAPMGLIFAIAGFGIFYGTRPGQSEVPVATVSRQDESKAIESARETAVPAQPPEVAGGAQIIPPSPVMREQTSAMPNRTVAARRTTNSRIVEESVGGASVDRTLESANTILPRGFESGIQRSGSANLNSNTARSQTQLRDVFEVLGISADFGDGGWKVRESIADGTAFRAGVRAGDVIRAIDGTTLTQSTRFDGQISVKVLQVIREGQALSFTLGK